MFIELTTVSFDVEFECDTNTYYLIKNAVDTAMYNLAHVVSISNEAYNTNALEKHATGGKNIRYKNLEDLFFAKVTFIDGTEIEVIENYDYLVDKLKACN